MDDERRKQIREEEIARKEMRQKSDSTFSVEMDNYYFYTRVDIRKDPKGKYSIEHFDWVKGTSRMNVNLTDMTAVEYAKDLAGAISPFPWSPEFKYIFMGYDF